MKSNNLQLHHWADQVANQILQTKGDKPLYTLASGITPSGTIHIGHFREIITVDFVKKALEARGKQVQFLMFWDDFDVFRRVPDDVDHADFLNTQLGKPLSYITLPGQQPKSYAQHHQNPLNNATKRLSIDLKNLSQTEHYQSGHYNEPILHALKHTSPLRNLLNRHRQKPLPNDWLPVMVYCNTCNHNTTSNLNYNSSKKTLSYHCNRCKKQDSTNLTQNTHHTKLLWRIDWPMRWSTWNIDFEPGGKDHSSEGGSFDTAKEITQQVFGKEPPIYRMYDFVTVKGAGGKMSSSLGNTISVQDALSVYEPPVLRNIFAGYRPNTEFALDLGLDVLKQHDQFDALESEFFEAFEAANPNNKKTMKRRRIYELANPNPPQKKPYRAPFRHLCNQLQIHDLNPEQVAPLHPNLTKTEKELFHQRATCAVEWVRQHAPEAFRFQLNNEAPPLNESLPREARPALTTLADHLETMKEPFNEQDVSSSLYSTPKGFGLAPKDFFEWVYLALIGRKDGPRLAPFIALIPKQRILKLLRSFVDAASH